MPERGSPFFVLKMGEIDEDTLCASDDAMTRGAGSRRGLNKMTNIPVSAPAPSPGLVGLVCISELRHLRGDSGDGDLWYGSYCGLYALAVKLKD